MLEKRKVLIFENLYTLTNFLLKKWAQIGSEEVKRKDSFTVALSGGKTPLEFYIRLSAQKDPYIWQDTYAFLTDERFLPIDHPDSMFFRFAV